MAQKHTNKKINITLRFNILNLFIYIVGIILIAKLFSLQIVHGAEYKEQSNTRLTRESTLEASRGAIVDKTGTELVTSGMAFSLEMYKSKVDTKDLNMAILNMVKILEKYECSYETSSFPVKIEPFEFTLQEEALTKWKQANKLEEEISAEETFYKFKKKYEIENENLEEVKKIINIRYLISQKGYSSTRALTISEDIPREAVAEFSESSEKFAGINIVVKPVRKYTSRKFSFSYIAVMLQE